MEKSAQQTLKKWTLCEGVIYGPIQSRRYGYSLGVNLLPSLKKLCTFNCIYCQCGWTKIRPDKVSAAEYPSSKEVCLKIRESLDRFSEKLQAITVCGNGEPTLHPKFYEISKEIRDVRDKLCSKMKLVCMTSGTEMYKPEVCQSLNFYDEVCVKMDAGSCELLQKINLPLNPFCIVCYVPYFKRIRNLVIQSCFVEGAINNTGSKNLEEWLYLLKRIKPKSVQIYSLDRHPPNQKIQSVPRKKLEKIAELVRQQGIMAKIF